MKKVSAKKIDDDLRPEYDLSQLKGGVRGKYYRQAIAGTNLMLIEPELAEAWDLGDMSATFNLRKNATFHDGSPVTARDVKWTFDRAVTVGGVPTFQLKAGSLEKAEQFVAVDDHTFRIDFQRKDKLTFPDLCVPTTGVINFMAVTYALT